MLSTVQGKKQDLIAKVHSDFHDKLDKKDADEASRLLGLLFERVAPDDVFDYSPEDIYGLTLNLWKFLAKRKPAQAQVKVYNPRIEQHGWTSSHTVVEIINDDMPFLVDSVTTELARHGLTVHRCIHPVFPVVRDKQGRRIAVGGDKDDAVPESVMHIEVDARSSKADLTAIRDGVQLVLENVRATVEDWPKMMAKLKETIEGLAENPPPLEAGEVAEGRALLEWMGDNHFTFLAYREYDYRTVKGKAELKIVGETGLGLYRDSSVRFMRNRSGGSTAAIPEVMEFLNRPELVIITKANTRSTVHRSVYLDYVGIKKFDAKGKVVGERRFIGLFTSAAYNRTPSQIPYLRRKIDRVMAKARVPRQSHDGKALMNILETYPRDELFQVSEDELLNISTGIMMLQERPRIRLFVRHDKFRRFKSCLIYVPRERYTTALRQTYGQLLAAAFNGRASAYYTQIGDSPLARLHFIIGLKPGSTEEADIERLESQIIDAARMWEDKLYDAMIERWGEETGNWNWQVYGKAFPTAYRETFNAAVGIFDIEKIATLSNNESLALNLYRAIEDGEDEVRLKIYHKGHAIALSDCLPMLEHMGLKVLAERPFEIRLGEEKCWLHDFLMSSRRGTSIDLGALKKQFEEAFAQVWFRGVEDDGFNQLVLYGGLNWREVVVLRAYCKYLRQAGIAFSQDYMEDTLASNPGIARLLVDLFAAMFDPDHPDRNKHLVELETEIDSLLEQVVSLDEDRILRRFHNLIQSTLRTNFFCRAEGQALPPALALKLDSANVSDLPKPVPYREIFVYSPRVEGVHLRGGKVARGGLRWSDRREDFRTEILGLMKAQMVKNAVIVPVGAKGGFVPKQLPPPSAGREAFLEEGIACYKLFVSSLLDVTDNISSVGEIVPPGNVVRNDDDDPYLVVAADKGTATFSDIANGIALDYGFWLGDAFASGGSAGYDHKKMAITARGAWESVKRHFREIGVDTQTTEFTVIGIGDMSGDVFGNGMLLSKHIRMLAAFDHRNIFIDPDPDPAKSWKERKRLFDMPRSSWADYSTKLISKGGGVFDRSAKSLALSAEIKALLGTKREEMTPFELINALLKAEADLLWIGGIGTYVKAAHESNQQAGDRANDAVRVNGCDLRFKVVGEGGNLGFTQAGRIEAGLAGVRLNTDAVDNSAGVDCSDHEVNIKILLGAVVADGEMTGKQRDRLLAEMTDEVADLVLIDNYLQTQAITAIQEQGGAALEPHARLMRSLERAGRLDRAIEFLPDEEELEERTSRNQGLTRPELSVLLSYAKMTLYQDLLHSDLLEDSYFSTDLVKYFPRPLRKRFPQEIQAHRLRREIIATTAANSIINRAGPTFINDMQEELDLPAHDIAQAYTVAREVFGLKPVWGAIQSLDNKVPATTQTRMVAATREALRRGTLWFLRMLPRPLDIAQTIEEYAPGIQSLGDNVEDILGSLEREAFGNRLAGLVKQGVPEATARRVSALEPLTAALDIVHAAKDAAQPIAGVGEIYFGVGARLGLDWLRVAAEQIAPENYWERQAVASLVDDLYDHQRDLTNAVLRDADGQAGQAAVNLWESRHGTAVQRSNQMIADFRASGGIDIAKLAIVSHHIRGLR